MKKMKIIVPIILLLSFLPLIFQVNDASALRLSPSDFHLLDVTVTNTTTTTVITTFGTSTTTTEIVTVTSTSYSPTVFIPTFTLTTLTTSTITTPFTQFFGVTTTTTASTTTTTTTVQTGTTTTSTSVSVTTTTSTSTSLSTFTTSTTGTFTSSIWNTINAGNVYVTNTIPTYTYTTTTGTATVSTTATSTFTVSTPVTTTTGTRITETTSTRTSLTTTTGISHTLEMITDRSTTTTWLPVSGFSQMDWSSWAVLAAIGLVAFFAIRSVLAKRRSQVPLDTGVYSTGSQLPLEEPLQTDQSQSQPTETQSGESVSAEPSRTIQVLPAPPLTTQDTAGGIKPLGGDEPAPLDWLTAIGEGITKQKIEAPKLPPKKPPANLKRATEEEDASDGIVFSG